jgi:hypothetical protein
MALPACRICTARPPAHHGASIMACKRLQIQIESYPLLLTDLNLEACRAHTTAEKILRDGNKTLTETVTKSNRFGKCRKINGEGRFIFQGTKK